MQVATGLRSLPRNDLGLIPVDIMAEAARAARARVLADHGILPVHIVSLIKKPLVRATPSGTVNKFMTPKEAERLLQEQVRQSGRCKDNLKYKQPRSGLAKDAIDLDDDIVINRGSCEREQFTIPDDWNVAIKRQTRYRGCSYRHAGRKPRNKKWHSLKASDHKRVSGTIDSNTWEAPFIWFEQLQKDMAAMAAHANL